MIFVILCLNVSHLECMLFLLNTDGQLCFRFFMWTCKVFFNMNYYFGKSQFHLFSFIALVKNTYSCHVCHCFWCSASVSVCAFWGGVMTLWLIHLPLLIHGDFSVFSLLSAWSPFSWDFNHSHHSSSGRAADEENKQTKKPKKKDWKKGERKKEDRKKANMLTLYLINCCPWLNMAGNAVLGTVPGSFTPQSFC